jgi:hypothetical protein
MVQTQTCRPWCWEREGTNADKLSLPGEKGRVKEGMSGSYAPGLKDITPPPFLISMATA